MNSTLIGAPVCDLPTPFLLADLEAIDWNLKEMARSLAGTGVGNAPL